MRLEWAVAVAGTHGKTTTTSMIAALLEAGGKDLTVINGGVINAYGANTRMGEGEWMVVEADESDGTFTRLRAAAVVVTNMDPEHLDHYGDVVTMNGAYRVFVESIPFYGFAVMCIDHPEVRALAARVQDRRIIRYGFDEGADVRAHNLRPSREGCAFDVAISKRGTSDAADLKDLFLPVAGRHNVQNATAAIAVARELGVSDDGVRQGLKSFSGVNRRFTITGAWNDVRVVDDYAHHPVEISAVLSAAREMSEGRVIAVAQPHRYSRLQALFEEFSTCFADADTVLVADIYPAGEAPIPGIDAAALVASLTSHGHADARKLESWDALAALVRAEAKPGDLVVCLGAGDITAHANALPAKLAAG
jgi:UDP-N-acetylmuramate--alanine ligase